LLKGEPLVLQTIVAFTTPQMTAARMCFMSVSEMAVDQLARDGIPETSKFKAIFARPARRDQAEFLVPSIQSVSGLRS